MNIVVIRFSSLGDVVLTQPVTRRLREHWPQATLTYVTQPVTAPLVRMFGTVDRVVEWQGDIHAAAAEIGPVDLLIDLQEKINSRMLSRALKAKRTVRYNKRHLLRRAIVQRLTHAEINSTLDLYATALAPLGLAANLPWPELFPADDDQKLIDELFVNYGVTPRKTLVGIFPGAKHPTKCYPAELFACFLNDIPAAWNCQFLLCGGPDDKPAALEVLRSTQDVIDLTGAVDTAGLAHLVRRLDCVISNDSGPMHVAAALRKPQIALFGATHPRLGFRPLNEKAVVVATEPRCQPCSLHGGKECPKGHFRCMRSIRPSWLLERFRRLLEESVWQLG